MYKQTVLSTELKRYKFDGTAYHVAVGSENPNDGYIVVTKESYLKEPTIEQLKSLVLNCIDEYDSSDNVNQFTLYGKDIWLDKATRVGLVNAVNAEITLGHEEVTLGLGGDSYTFPCEQALQLLASLEVYALACYNKTLEHKRNVNNFEKVEDIINYDYCKGYPDKIVI